MDIFDSRHQLSLAKFARRITEQALLVSELLANVKGILPVEWSFRGGLPVSNLVS